MAEKKQPVAKDGDKKLSQDGDVKKGGNTGVRGKDMLKMGRGLAKVANQKRGG